MTDTQRWDMLSCYGNSDMQTPHLDRLASEGIRFERAYTCQPVCGPARGALFTGLWPHNNGSWANNMPLGANVKTIGQRLRDNGLRAAYIGKWHLDGSDYFGLGRCPDGWDPGYWYDMRNYLEELSTQDRLRSRRFETCLEPGFSADFTYAHRCSNRAIRFLQNHGNDDFLLVVSYDEPHGPSLCPAPYNTMYNGYEFPKRRNVWDTLENKPEHQRVWAGKALGTNKDEMKIHQPAFLGCNSFVDSEIGKLMEAVNQYAPDSLVIYTSDHGDVLGSHSITNKGPAMYDEITRIPLIVRWPQVTPPHTICPHAVSHIDLVPTIMDAAGLSVPKSLEGRSMLDVFQNPSAPANQTIFMEFGRYETDHDGFGGFQPIRAAFDGRYKLVINLLSSDELYDLQTDPDEMTNLIDSPAHAPARDALHDSLLGWMNTTRDPFRGYHWERRPWRSGASAATWAYTGMTRQRENEEYEPRQLDYDTGLEMDTAVRKK
ncbi:MAG: sulfatase-like hydrolase/transferase [Chloroflexi bacterium]|nr:sulfatase-like hydrolase/transferase [Chloroflexota bacterium]